MPHCFIVSMICLEEKMVFYFTYFYLEEHIVFYFQSSRKSRQLELKERAKLLLQRARQENEGKQREQEASVECPTEENPSTADSKSEAEVCCLVPVYRGLRAKKVYVYISKRVLRTFSLSTLGISSLLSCNILNDPTL